MGSCLSSQIKTGGRDSGGGGGGGNSKLGSRSGKSCNSGSSRRVSAAESENEELVLSSSNLKNFSYNDLRVATRNFRPDTVLGEGGFGCVFKGWIDEHTFAAARPGTGLVIAVKKLNLEGFQGHKEWLTEIGYLGQLYHPNLVKLIGYCLEDDHRLLVYEFMPKGSLENHLFRRSPHFQPLSWSLRMKVALGAAKGLAFLHSPEAKVIYRDFKASNILLDSNYDAKLSDFGLAKDGPQDGKSHVSTRVMGTYGYAAPEYMATGHLTTKSDVYSYGVVLLEMLTGKRVVDKNRPPGEVNLIEWARPNMTSKQRILHIMDARIEGQYTLGGAIKVATLAIKCLATEPRLRPNMNEVLKALEQLQESSRDSVVPRNVSNRSQPNPSRRRRHVDEGSNARAAAYLRPTASPIQA